MSEKDVSFVEVDYDPFAAEETLSRVIPSSEAQKEIWLSIQMAEGASCAFNESVTLHFSGELNTAALKKAVHYLITRHEALRTTFTQDGSGLCIGKSLNIEIPLLEGDEDQLQKLLVEEAETTFDLEKGPLIRCTVMRFSENDYYFILSAHHIICDGWSLAILVNDLGIAYSAYCNQQQPVQEAALSFSEFSSQIKEEYANSDDEAYWLNLFSKHIPKYDLPLDNQRPALRTFNAKRLDYYADTELMGRVKKAASANGCSLTAIMLSAYYLCLHRWTGEDTLVVGIPAASQPSYDPETLVGHCVNLLPILMSVDSAEPFAKLMQAVSERVLTSYEHQNYTYGTLLKKLPVDRDPSRIPLVPVLFNVDQGIQGSQLQFTGLKVDFHSNPRHFENFEIFINASDYGENFIIECQYNTDLFDEASINQRLHEYEQVLKVISEDINIEIGNISLLSAQERGELLEQQATEKKWSISDRIHDLIAAQASANLEAPAVHCNGRTISYGELNTQSNQFAHYLISQGVQPGMLVGLCLDRSTDMLVALLGVLKSGAGYVPLDPEYPDDRLAYMIEDAKLEYLITQKQYKQKLPSVNHTTEIDSFSEILAEHSADDPAVNVAKENTAYVIYTSGSTGKPKGVMVQHGAVVNFLNSMAERPGLKQNDILLAVTTLSFDIAVLELYLPLVVGAQLVIATREEAIDGNKLLTLINDMGVTTMQATPATWRMLISSGWEGKNNFKVLCGGEALPLDLAEQLLQRCAELWNMYGPTETTVWSTCQHVTDTTQPVSIGQPIANTEIYILDEKLQPVPNGIPGELFIGGQGVTKGYLNRAELTAEKFLDNPFSGTGQIYRTGDKVRYRKDGALDYMGRLDSQVKLRGFRIELGEIETLMRQHDGIKDCALAIKEHSAGDARLIAYVIWQNAAVEVMELRNFLSEWIPNYMVPQHIVEIAELPKTPNGKLDRRALPEPQFDELPSQELIAPETETETLIHTIWQDILGLESISTTDNFFNIGGHSLLATQIVTRLRNELELSLSISAIFECPTIKQLAGRLDNTAQDDISVPPAINRRTVNDPARITQGQQRLWYLQQLYPDLAVFNLIAAWRLLGDFDVEAFSKSLNTIARRHEILHSKFELVDDVPELVILPEKNIDLEKIDMQSFTKEEREQKLIQYIEEKDAQPYEFEKGYLLQASLLTLSAEEHVMVVKSHPIMWDGWSFDIFLKEMAECYAAFKQGLPAPLPELSLQYIDYSIWHYNWMQAGVAEKQLQYWKAKLAGATADIPIPKDRPRPKIPTYQGWREPLFIPKETVDKITEFAHAEGLTLYMVLLTAFKILLMRCSQQQDLLLATHVQGRVRPEFEVLIGPFVNTVYLRTHIEKQLSFHDALQNVRQTCLEAFSNQDVPFERLLDEVTIERGQKNAPPYQVMITFQDTTNRGTTFADMDIVQINHPVHIAYTDLLFWLKETGHGLYGGMDYSTELYNKERIALLMKNYVHILDEVIVNPNVLISDIGLLNEDELLSSPVQIDSNTPSETAGTVVNHQLPETTMQKYIADIWREVLELDHIEIYDNFFDLGGYSLQSMQVLEQIRKETGVHVPARSILMNTLAQIAEYCENPPEDSETEADQNDFPAPSAKPFTSRLKSIFVKK